MADDNPVPRQDRRQPEGCNGESLRHDRDRVLKGSEALRGVVSQLQGERISLDRIMDILGRHQIGAALLVFAIPALLPSPGLPVGMIFGTGLILIAAQMIAGADPLQLPGWLGRHAVSASTFSKIALRGASVLERFERFLRPRYLSLTSAHALPWLGLFILVQAILIALPIPFGNTLPALAVVMIALGFMSRDGAMTITGILTGIVGIAFDVLVVFMGVTLVRRFI